jgi:DNA-binding HxlR family transcriptional regulator
MSGTNKRVTRKAPSHTEQSCRPVREVLNRVGDKWSILIVSILDEGTKRFSEIQHSIEGISQRMLTRTMRELERDGLLTRRVEPTVPPSVYYSLTPLGKTLLVPVRAVAQWAFENYKEINEAQQAFDKKNLKG